MRLQPAALMSEPTWPSDDEEMILLDNLLLVTCNRVSDRRQLRLDGWCLWSVLRVMDSVVTVIYSHLVCIPASRLPDTDPVSPSAHRRFDYCVFGYLVFRSCNRGQSRSHPLLSDTFCPLDSFISCIQFLRSC